jgi:hypothetical protein
VECRTACIKVQCPPEPECDISRCQLVNDARGCAFCSCPPPQRTPPLFPQPPTVERPPQCPPLDVNLCVEPCIIFSNRRGCKECVCPVLPSQLPTVAETAPEHISMPHQPLPPVQFPKQQERESAPVTAPKPPAANKPVAIPRPPGPQVILEVELQTIYS